MKSIQAKIITKLEEIKMAMWNLCLGLTNKKDYVTEIIKEKRIDICCMQEKDVRNDQQ